MRRSILPVDTLTAWAKDKGVVLNGIAISSSPSGHGAGLVATSSCNETGSIFVQVPSNLLLNTSLVWTLSATDPDLADILTANEELAKSTRGAILIFLLMQIAHSSPDILTSTYAKLPVGKQNIFSDYVQYIQTEKSLPLFWPTEDVEHLWGTSLSRHHRAKMRFLNAEFNQFRKNCQSLPWAEIWFGTNGCLGFEDWLVVDAMWRSRAMDLSSPDDKTDGKSACLVPIMDMANHTTDGIAAYKLFAESNGSSYARLLLDKPNLETSSEHEYLNCIPPDRHVAQGDEITISYGSIKGAAEMIFSYGFLDENMPDARSMMLGWSLPEDDPLRFEKMAALNLEPGIQIYTPVSGSKTVRFVGTAVWAMSVNEEDGLRIVANGAEPVVDPGSRLVNEEQGTEEVSSLQMFFKDTLITSKAHLIDVLTHDRAALVFRTRAMAYVYMRIEEELERLDLQMQNHLEVEQEGKKEEEEQREEGKETEVQKAKDRDEIEQSPGESEPHQETDEADPVTQSTTTSSQTLNTSPSSSQARTCAVLRTLEHKLLSRASSYFANELSHLTQHPDVINYPLLLEQGLPLPELSGEELWSRYEGEHDEDNRVKYDTLLGREMEKLTMQNLDTSGDTAMYMLSLDGTSDENHWDGGDACTWQDQEAVGWQEDFTVRDEWSGRDEWVERLSQDTEPELDWDEFSHEENEEGMETSDDVVPFRPDNTMKAGSTSYHDGLQPFPPGQRGQWQ